MGEMWTRKNKNLSQVFEIFPHKNEISETLNLREIGPKTGQTAQIQPKGAYSYLIECKIYDYGDEIISRRFLLPAVLNGKAEFFWYLEKFQKWRIVASKICNFKLLNT